MEQPGDKHIEGRNEVEQNGKGNTWWRRDLGGKEPGEKTGVENKRVEKTRWEVSGEILGEKDQRGEDQGRKDW